MNEQDKRKAPINPHLKELFRTALEGQASPEQRDQKDPPKVIVNGSNNVLSWGGTVHIRHVAPPGGARAAS